MADDAPVIFKRKQSKLSQSSRARPVEDSVATGPEEGAVQENSDSPAAVASRLRKQQKARQKLKPQVSFGGDDEVRVSGSPEDPILTFFWVWSEQEGDGEVVKIKKSNLSKKIALAKASASHGCVGFCYYALGFVLRLIYLCSVSSHDPLSSVNNNASTPRYDASYLSELKATTPGSRPTTDNRTESYSVDVPIDHDVMFVDDATGKWHATLFTGSIH